MLRQIPDVQNIPTSKNAKQTHTTHAKQTRFWKAKNMDIRSGWARGRPAQPFLNGAFRELSLSKTSRAQRKTRGNTINNL